MCWSSGRTASSRLLGDDASRLGQVPELFRHRVLLCIAVLLFAPGLAQVQTTLAPPENVVLPAPLIMIDPAHGGPDSGALLSAAFPEKDVTLVLARRLRQELAVRGVQVQLVRDGDEVLSLDQRAALVNAAHPALYIALHATSQGGLRVFSAMLPAAEGSRGPFLSWNSAQAGALTRSRLLANVIAVAMQKFGSPPRSLSAPLRPLNNIIVPAIAVEIAPSAGDVSQLASSDFQQQFCSALARAIVPLFPVPRSQTQVAP